MPPKKMRIASYLAKSRPNPRSPHQKIRPIIWYLIQISTTETNLTFYTLINLTNLFFLTKNNEIASYGDLGGFDTTEMSGNIFCVAIDPGSPIFCLTE